MDNNDFDMLWVGGDKFLVSKKLAAAVRAEFAKKESKHVNELEAARALIEVFLTRPEWDDDDDAPYPYCLFCYGNEPRHQPDCPRQLALAAWEKARGEG